MRWVVAVQKNFASCTLSLLFASIAVAAEPTALPLTRLETGMHTASIKRIATDAEGKWAVTASDDKTARIWDVATGTQTAILRPPQGYGEIGKLYAVAISPNSATIALGGHTGAVSRKNVEVYIFERASGRLTHTIEGLPDVVNHLAFSPDGKWLAVALRGKNGIRIFDINTGKSTARDSDYYDDSYSVAFNQRGTSLVSTSFDGALRAYSLEHGRIVATQRSRPSDKGLLYSAKYSMDGSYIAVGFADSNTIKILNSETLEVVASPDIEGVDNGNLARVAWSSDGKFIYAAGRWDSKGRSHARRWQVKSWQHDCDVAVSSGTLYDLTPLPNGDVLVASADPEWGKIGADCTYEPKGRTATLDFRGPDRLRVSFGGESIRYVDKWPVGNTHGFDLVNRTLGGDIENLPVPRIFGIDVSEWEDETNPILNNRLIELERHEVSRSAAVSFDNKWLILGTDWAVRLLDRGGKLLWRQSAPDVAWAVTFSGNGRFVVAAFGDGTIRWYRRTDGDEVLAFFPHLDGKRWIMWTPQGFYSASGADAEDLLGYHLNRGSSQQGEFIVARQLRELYYQPSLISRRLDPDGDELVADAVSKLGDVSRLFASQQYKLHFWNYSLLRL